METTESQDVAYDGTIEGAIANLIEPEEGSEELLDNEELENEEGEEEAPAEPEEEEDADEEEDDSEDEDDTDDAVQSGQQYTVKIDGEEVAVTIDELKQGYSGQKYVQKGMQDAAAQRKEAESVYNALLQERQHVAQMYQQMQAEGVQRQPVAPSRELFDSDPIGFMDAKLRYDDDMAAYSQQAQQFEQLSAQQTKAQESAQRAYLQQEMVTLQKVIPEFSDQKKASAVRDKILKAGTEIYGFQADAISQVMDHREIRILHDAMKYHEIINGKKAAEEKANPANRRSRAVKAGSKSTSSSAAKRQKKRSKLQSTGSIEDALGLILNS